MNWPVELGKRSQLARGGRIAACCIFLGIGVASIFLQVQPPWVSWILLATCVLGILVVSFWQGEEREELDAEDLIEVARQAIRNESERLDRKRADIEKILMAYGEWMEFPEFQTLQSADWRGEVRVATDKKVAEILDNEADEMLRRFSSGYYWEEGKFDTRRLMLDLFSFMEEIARIYRPDADKPMLETNLEDLLKAVNRASLQIILLLEEIPMVEVKEMNLRKISDNVRKASKVYRKYEEIQPYLEPVRYLWQGSKLLLASNPLLAAGWIAGSELIWKGGKRLGKKAVDAYLLSLVRQTLGIVAWETSSIYDKTNRYRGPDWVYGVELVHMLSQFDLTREALQAAFHDLGSLPLRSSYDRIFLYRCLTQHISPKPKHFAQADLLAPDTREKIYLKLTDFFEANLSANVNREDKATRQWLSELTERLNLGSEGVATGE